MLETLLSSFLLPVFGELAIELSNARQFVCYNATPWLDRWVEIEDRGGPKAFVEILSKDLFAIAISEICNIAAPIFADTRCYGHEDAIVTHFSG
jgi:hypothetical protein